ncbi:unnamed protein product, partial [Ectocarpus sp. 6 AP-2014]
VVFRITHEAAETILGYRRALDQSKLAARVGSKGTPASWHLVSSSSIMVSSLLLRSTSTSAGTVTSHCCSFATHDRNPQRCRRLATRNASSRSRATPAPPLP